MSAALAVAKAQDVPSRAEPEAMETTEAGQPQEDLYTKLKTLQRQLEFLEIQVRRGSAGRAPQFACALWLPPADTGSPDRRLHSLPGSSSGSGASIAPA